MLGGDRADSGPCEGPVQLLQAAVGARHRSLRRDADGEGRRGLKAAAPIGDGPPPTMRVRGAFRDPAEARRRTPRLLKKKKIGALNKEDRGAK